MGDSEAETLLCEYASRLELTLPPSQLRAVLSALAARHAGDEGALLRAAGNLAAGRRVNVRVRVFADGTQDYQIVT